MKRRKSKSRPAMVAVDRSASNGSFRVTAKDIARAAGVSQATVSMALRGSVEISESRIEQIKNLADQMNYHPRAAAQLLRSKRAGQIGILVAASDAVHAFSRGFTGPLLGSLVDACVRQGQRYIIEFHRHDEDSEVPHLPYQVTSGLVDGSVLIGDVGEPLRRRLNGEYPNFPWVSIEEPSRYCVLTDSRQGVLQVVQKLYDLGHRRLAYACGDQRYFTHHEGLAGWEEATRNLNLDIPQGWNLIFGSSEDKGIGSAEAVEWARRLLRAPGRPTAFVCHDMVVARAVIHVAVECGLSVPRDLSVTSWGWHLTAQEQYPALSTVELDYRAMITRGMELLNTLFEPNDFAETKIVVNPRYVEGATVGPVPEMKS